MWESPPRPRRYIGRRGRCYHLNVASYHRRRRPVVEIGPPEARQTRGVRSMKCAPVDWNPQCNRVTCQMAVNEVEFLTMVFREIIGQ